MIFYSYPNKHHLCTVQTCDLLSLYLSFKEISLELLKNYTMIPVLAWAENPVLLSKCLNLLWRDIFQIPHPCKWIHITSEVLCTMATSAAQATPCSSCSLRETCRGTGLPSNLLSALEGPAGEWLKAWKCFLPCLIKSISTQPWV